MKVGISIAPMFLYFVSVGQAASEDWLKSPQPKFPQTALKNYSEGSVRLRVLLGEDGSVRDARVIKSSGVPTLDREAEQAVLQWKMKPTAVKSKDLTQGRDEIVEFRQEAPIAAVYPDRVAYVGSKQSIGSSIFSKIMMFAPFPAYPVEARQYHEQGTAIIGFTIGKTGNTENAHLIRSSGFKILDNSALRAVALWRAHQQYAGQKVAVPITFTLTARGAETRLRFACMTSTLSKEKANVSCCRGHDVLPKTNTPDACAPQKSLAGERCARQRKC